MLKQYLKWILTPNAAQQTSSSHLPISAFQLRLQARATNPTLSPGFPLEWFVLLSSRILLFLLFIPMLLTVFLKLDTFSTFPQDFCLVVLRGQNPGPPALFLINLKRIHFPLSANFIRLSHRDWHGVELLSESPGQLSPQGGGWQGGQQTHSKMARSRGDCSLGTRGWDR